MNSFLTGSRVYGTPHEGSDVDLVVRMTYDDICKLAGVAGVQLDVSDGGQKSVSLKFGKLNLIATYDDSVFATWRMGTDDLRGQSPVTRSDAVAHFKKLRELRKVKKTPIEQEQLLPDWA